MNRPRGDTCEVVYFVLMFSKDIRPWVIVIARIAVHLTENGIATDVGDVGEKRVVVTGPVAFVN